MSRASNTCDNLILNYNCSYTPMKSLLGDLGLINDGSVAVPLELQVGVVRLEPSGCRVWLRALWA